MLVCSLFPLPPSPMRRCCHYYHCLLGGTVDCHRDCIRSCYSCVILAELQAETEGYARPYGWRIEMNVSTCSWQVLVLLFSFSLPTKEPFPLLTSPSSSPQRPDRIQLLPGSNQIPATVQWRGPISDNAIAACLSGCTYVCTLVRETIQSCIKFFSLYLSCYLWLYSIMYFKLDNVTTIMQKKL